MCKSCSIAYAMNRWTERKLKAIEQFGGKCLDCGKKYPHQVYEFHHLDPKTKKFTWTKLRLQSEKTLKLELAKCVLLCANCHRIRHINLNDASSD